MSKEWLRDLRWLEATDWMFVGIILLMGGATGILSVAALSVGNVWAALIPLLGIGIVVGLLKTTIEGSVKCNKAVHESRVALAKAQAAYEEASAKYVAAMEEYQTAVREVERLT
jgi:hypothetical protein